VHTWGLEKLIRIRLERQPGFQVQAARSPKNARRRKGMVIPCTAPSAAAT
jgi:hypothetical protein